MQLSGRVPPQVPLPTFFNFFKPTSNLSHLQQFSPPSPLTPHAGLIYSNPRSSSARSGATWHAITPKNTTAPLFSALAFPSAVLFSDCFSPNPVSLPSTLIGRSFPSVVSPIPAPRCTNAVRIGSGMRLSPRILRPGCCSLKRISTNALVVVGEKQGSVVVVTWWIWKRI